MVVMVRLCVVHDTPRQACGALHRSMSRNTTSPQERITLLRPPIILPEARHTVELGHLVQFADRILATSYRCHGATTARAKPYLDRLVASENGWGSFTQDLAVFIG